jgi:DNA-binding CsgD family transcriptional regulator
MTLPTVVGRAGELGTVTALVRGALDGRFGALVVEGDPGAGKTTLLRAGLEAAGDRALVLEGACLPMTSVTVPLIGLRSAVRALPEHERPAVLARGGEGAARSGAPPAALPVALDDWLSRLTHSRPVVLVVDDLQWADAQTLDTLTYVLAGPPRRPLAVLVAVRSAGAGPAHPVQGWLADVRRLPNVAQCPLAPLSRDGVEELVALVLGGPAHSSLVDDVARRSGGNPYFARLLLTGVDPSEWSLPRHLPVELRDAAARPFATLSESTRRLLVALAVGGRPASDDDLARVAAVSGLVDATAALEEAVAAGVLDVDPDGTSWFHHPVQAEVVEQDLLPHARRALNARFADAYAEGAAEEPDAALAETVSDHLVAAGRPGEAYRWAVSAADRLASTGDRPGRLRMLRRAVALHRSAPGAGEQLVDLLEEVRVLAREVADWVAQLEAVDGLRREVDHREEPLRLAVLEAWAQRLSFRVNVDAPPGGLARALDLSASHPVSWQRAVVLCEQARTLLWAGDLEPARAAVAGALAAARDAGDRTGPVGGPGSERDEADRARALAEADAAMLAVFAGDAAAALEHARSATEAATGPRDGESLFLATTWAANAVPHPASTRVARLTEGRRRMERLGVPQPFLARLAGSEALAWLDAGDAAASGARLRVALGAGASPRGNGLARLAAALLATRLGRQEQAEAHLARAREVLAGEWSHSAFPSEAVAATVHLGRAGGAAEALEVACEGLGRPGAAPSRCEWLAPLAARALADLAGADRDVGVDPSAHLDRLHELRAATPHVVRDVGPVDDAYRRVLAALDALYDAESARALASADAAPAWVAAVEGLHTAALPWEESYASLRAAEALLAHGGAPERREAAAVLRRGHALAVRLGDEPVRAAVEALARSARLRLGPVRTEPATAFDGLLSRREREVLSYVVAGRTYAETAEALHLSRKTVSSHISNILRKTGTSNRVELASWARRRAGTRAWAP